MSDETVREDDESSFDTEPTMTASGHTPSPVARKATGPRTAMGKATSRRNALKFGIFSNAIVLDGESRPEFELLLGGLRQFHQPEGTLEEVLVDKLSVLLWRYRRLITADSKASIEYQPNLCSLIPELQSSPWEVLIRYEANLDRAIDRTLNQLERLQRTRLGQHVPPPISVNVSSSA